MFLCGTREDLWLLSSRHRGKKTPQWAFSQMPPNPQNKWVYLVMLRLSHSGHYRVDLRLPLRRLKTKGYISPRYVTLVQWVQPLLFYCTFILQHNRGQPCISVLFLRNMGNNLHIYWLGVINSKKYTRVQECQNGIFTHVMFHLTLFCVCWLKHQRRFNSLTPLQALLFKKFSFHFSDRNSPI